MFYIKISQLKSIHLLKYKIMKSQLNLIAAALILLFCSSNTIHAQSMGISNAAITPDPSSILEMRTT
ncbi:MAG: hypothetical protein ACI93N_001446, partial [Flavobacteriaceae bacterium]